MSTRGLIPMSADSGKAPSLSSFGSFGPFAPSQNIHYVFPIKICLSLRKSADKDNPAQRL
jgi:hypothetical protein